MWQDYYSVISIEDTIRILADKGQEARIIAGATDLMLEIERGVRKGINTLIDILLGQLFPLYLLLSKKIY